MILPWFAHWSSSATMAVLNRRAARERWLKAGRLARCVFIGLSFLWPISGTVSALYAIGKWGREARRSHGVGFWTQLRGTLTLAHRFGLDPIEFFRFKPFLKGDLSGAKNFLAERQLSALQDSILKGVNTQVLSDKYLFYRHCVAHSIPALSIWARSVDGELVWEPGASEQTIEGKDVFVKPSRLSMGQGTELWSYSGRPENHAWSWKDQLLGKEALLSHLARLSANGIPFIVQPRELNHDQLRPLAGNALATIRVVTGISSHLPPAIISARLAIPAPGKHHDHGALGAGINLHTGELGTAVYEYFKGKPFAQSQSRTAEYPRHPINNSQIEGLVLDGWKEICSLCLKAHASLPEIPFIGWDVATTPHGPLLVEGNDHWGTTTSQIARMVPLGATEFPGIVMSNCTGQVNQPYPG